MLANAAVRELAGAPFFQDKARGQRVLRTLRDAAGGRKVSQARLQAAQEFLVELLEEVDRRRPQHLVVCGRNVLRHVLWW
ncbi:MAG: hypothetical protein A3A44_03640 [Candidatus Sungbacteria bacterium RIFCSPLOWO2_01_FULL_60_25]|uniref:Uncharacterized protein n=1 Tax=Candidatus Sungbacteria bacterium RIFCSPLOWO2_01_FULL_60_25 TaxID=1802281 RepID=A0A1G2LE72_9BACT|nr:MAG: hypothetical protein A3A44_03640 [Candidatus Sungbacteria bacterium RIFCSPLOWO2_01_FULL_60_25]